MEIEIPFLMEGGTFMNDMKKDRLKFRTIGAYMSVVYVLIGLLTVAAIFALG